MNGAQILLECLRREGVEIVFGYPGGAVLPLFDKIYDSPIKFILVRHEQAAAHAADGYARATGRVGVCIATSGPGAINLATGIATAYMDSISMIAITGQVRTSLIGQDAFQEADITGITRSITKHNYLIKDIGELSQIMREAFHIASTGRPGPVLVDVPVDIQQKDTEFIWREDVHLRGYNPTYYGHPGQIKKAAKMISLAHKPLVIAGGGIISSNAYEELKALAEKIRAPVAVTLMGLGSFPGIHPYSLGMLGMHGNVHTNHAVMDADLIIAVGVRFDDRVTGRLDTFAPHARIIHIDIDPTSIGKNVKVHVPIVGDAKNILSKLLKTIEGDFNHESWLETIETWKKRHPPSYHHNSAQVKPQYVVEQIYEATKGEAIIVTEVGQNQMWAAQWYKYNFPRSFISSGGLGTMGFGFPASMGVKIGRPDRQVFVIAGDGSIQMNIQELATCVGNRINVKVAILNNGFLGMVRQWQELFYKRRYSHTRLDNNPDFVRLAESYGAAGIRVTRKDEVRPAIEKALKIDNVVFLDFHVEPEENVFPMVPAGEAINKIIEGMA